MLKLKLKKLKNLKLKRLKKPKPMQLRLLKEKANWVKNLVKM